MRSQSGIVELRMSRADLDDTVSVLGLEGEQAIRIVSTFTSRTCAAHQSIKECFLFDFMWEGRWKRGARCATSDSRV